MTEPAVDVPALRVEDLHVYRGDAHVLQGLTFEIRPRAVTALLGRNGAGKTTTLLAVLGLLAASGRVLHDGQDVSGVATHARVQGGMAYVPEDREVFTQLTVAENLRLACRSADSAQRLERAAELFPILRERSQQKAGTLSGGQQQMLAIARALLNPSRLLLIDEPSKGLAPIVVQDVVDALQQVSRDSTVLLVEQNLRVAERLATDAIVLDQGTVVYTGSMSSLAADDELSERYLGVALRKGV